MNNHCRRSPPLRRALLLTAFAFAAVPAQAQQVPAIAAEAATEGQELYLEVTLNQMRNPQLFRFVDRDGRFFAHADTLAQIGFDTGGRAPDRLTALDEFPGVSARYDAGAQRIAIDAPLSQLSLATTRLNMAADGGPLQAQASPGVLLNYDLYASQQDQTSNLSATAELRLFGIGDGVFSNSALTRAYRAPGLGWHGETVRLDSSWQLSFPESAISLTVGDTFSGFLNWTRTVRLGGFQIGRNFGLQPYRITSPLPAFLGEVAVPSAVDLYINGIKQYTGELPVGPFQLATVPGITGAGNAQIVVTDAFGRTRTLDFPFYATQQLLAKGLSDWSVSAGLVREDYGVRSFSYGDDPAASANLRYGISDSFTIEAHAEATDRLANAGGGGLWLLGRAGVLGAAYSYSTLDGDRGSLTALSYNWSDGRFNFSADSQRTHGQYRDIAALYGAPPPQVSERALAGVTLQRLGNISLNYVRLRYPDTDPSRYAGAFWSQTFAGNWSASLSLNQNLDRSEDRSLYVGFAVPLDGNRQTGASWQRNGDRDQAVADFSKPLPADGGFGYRLQARAGDDASGGLAEGGWINDAGRYSLGIASFDGDSYGYAGANGALVLMGGHAFASRSVDDAFALVTTAGVAGVPVKLENRSIGRTDDDGMLLVTPINAWQRNKLSIDPMDLPADMRIEAVDKNAVPRERSGVRVDFGIVRVKAGLLILHDRNGRPLPLGSTVRVEGAVASDAFVGYDGETYMESLGDRNRLRAQTPDGGCSVIFDYPRGTDAIPRIGPLICVPDDSP